MTDAKDIRVGCSGFPKARSAYFEHFSLTEVQQTFYQPPRIETLQRWRQDAPPAFEFTIKAWQLITHEPKSPTYRRLRAHVPRNRRDRYGSFRPTDEVLAAWQTTRDAAKALHSRVIIFQCPASFTATDSNIANMRAFFHAIRADAADFVLGWEPRGNWPNDVARSLCKELGLIHVVDPFQTAPPDDQPLYFRLHGIGGYQYRYTDADLRRLLGMCRGTTYCLFNNVWMAEDAERFLGLVRSMAA